MSHIHNLTSHLKNTTITPAPTPPQQTYRLPQNGLKIYQMQQNVRMMTPHHHQQQQQQVPSPHHQGHPQISVARKGGNLGGIINAILPNTTTLTRTPNHLNANINSSTAQIQFQPQQLSQLQQQLKRPPMTRGPTPLVNHIQAHQSPHKSGVDARKFIPAPPSHQPPINISQNHHQVNHHHHNVANNNHHHHHGQLFNSPNHKHLSSSPISSSNAPVGLIPSQAHKPTQPARNSSPAQKDVSFRHNNNNNSGSGGAARVQHVTNHVNQNRKSVATISPSTVAKYLAKKLEGTKEIKPPPAVVVKTEEQEEPQEVSAIGPRPFQKGDDVLFTTDDGTFMFGTVGMIHGETLQILFGDGTQQLAEFNKVKLLSCSVEDDDDDDSNTTTSTPNNAIHVDTNNRVENSGSSHSSTSLSKPNNKVVIANSLASPVPVVPVGGGVATLASEEVTCGSCGVVKKVAGKKALNYAPHTKTQFNCRRCVNKSRFCKSNNMPIAQTPSSPNRGKTANTSPSSKNRRQSDESSGTNNVCFHCEKATNYNDRLHCNLCERACHLSCLAMTPPPLEGDRFWDVICSACGTQNGDSGAFGRTKVFSCRRSITSWSDVAHLILSCLASQPESSGERFFDLEKDVIPFIMEHTDRLHLPRTYKNIQSDSRKEFLGTALHNATLRFLNGAEVNRNDTLWAIRENNNHQGYPLRVPAAAKSPQKSSAPNKLPITPTRPIRTTSSLASSPGRGAVLGSLQHGRRSSIEMNGSCATPSPPKLDKYDIPFSKSISPAKSNKSSSRLMSQTERLVQKAKKQCQQKKVYENELDSNKRKTNDVTGSPQSNKRPKLSPDRGSNGICLPSTKTPSPISSKQVTEWLQCLNAATNRTPITPNSSANKNKASPLLSGSSSLFGKAVKSAGITPPGNSQSPEKPSLRIRKPKAFDLSKDKSGLQKNKDNNETIQTKAFGKLKGRLAKQALKAASNSNVATQRFSQIPAANGAIPTEELIAPSEFSLLNSSVEDLITHGSRYTLHSLPKAPETSAELQKLKQKVAEAYASETSTPPAYIKSSINGKPNRKEKSKRDLKNLASYEITGKWVNASGIVHYHCEWKDGYGNDSDDDDNENELLIEWDDLDDTDLLFKCIDNLPTDIPNKICHITPAIVATSDQSEEDRKPVMNNNSHNDESDTNRKANNNDSKLAIKNEKIESPIKSEQVVVRPHPFFVPNGLKLNRVKSKEDGKIIIDLTSDD